MQGEVAKQTILQLKGSSARAKNVLDYRNLSPQTILTYISSTITLA